MHAIRLDDHSHPKLSGYTLLYDLKEQRYDPMTPPPPMGRGGSPIREIRLIFNHTLLCL